MSSADRLSVLAVEDEAMIAMELEDMLADLGHSVIGPAPTVDAALALLRDSSPDAAVVDANLGGESARPLIETLRELGIPVVIATGYETPVVHDLGPATPLVRKPYAAKDLAKALQAAHPPPTPRNGSD